MKILRLLSLAALLTCLTGGAWAASGGAFYNEGVTLASDFVANPAAFFFDFQQDMESTNPLPPTKNYDLNWHFGQFLPIIPPYVIIPIPDPTILNLSGKVKILRENGLFPGMPQIDAIGGYWNAGPLLQPFVHSNAASCSTPNCTATGEPNDAAHNAAGDASDPSVKIKKASFNGDYYGLVLTSSVEPRVRLYYGWKYSTLDASLNLSKPVDVLGSDVSSFSTGYHDNFAFFGVEHPTSVNTFWLMSMSYGVGQKSLMTRVSWYRKYMELALDVYPEGVLVLHPSLNFHINF